jgi:hypothetical protein
MPIPTLAAPVDPTAYRGYFQNLAEDLLLLAWKARARIRIWNYWRTGVPDGTWHVFTPYISLTRDGSTYPSYRYRLCLSAFFWGIDIGLVKSKRVAVHGEYTTPYDPDEANERP